MRPLNVKRYMQDPAECAVASAASCANFANRKIDYELTRDICKDYVLDGKNCDEGLWSGETGLLLNHLGFKKVTIISSDLTVFDYSWKNLSKQSLIQELNKAKRKRSLGQSAVSNWKRYYQFLTESSKNNVIIDYRFAPYIKEALDLKYPIIISFNWTMFFEFSKATNSGLDDPLGGEDEHHAVAVRGYNKTGVHIVDSHHRFYKYSRSKFKNGYYTIPWLELMTIMGQGDVIIAEEYDNNWKNPYELVSEKDD